MKYCPICELGNHDSATKCDCGFNFEKDQIENRINFRKGLKWDEQVDMKKRIHKFQMNQYGKKTSRSPEAKGWSKRMTAKLLHESPATIVQDIALSEALEASPDLRSCKTKKDAWLQIKGVTKIEDQINITEKEESSFDHELQLKYFLRQNWNKTPFSNEWLLEGCEYDTHKVGRIDFLAQHKKESRWLVIELKLLAREEAVAQTLRYMGWVKENIAGNDGQVQGLIISETADEYIRYALIFVPNVKLCLYRSKNGQLDFRDFHSVYIDSLLKQMSSDQLEELMKKLEHNNSTAM